MTGKEYGENALAFGSTRCPREPAQPLWQTQFVVNVAAFKSCPTSFLVCPHGNAPSKKPSGDGGPPSETTIGCCIKVWKSRVFLLCFDDVACL